MKNLILSLSVFAILSAGCEIKGAVEPIKVEDINVTVEVDLKLDSLQDFYEEACRSAILAENPNIDQQELQDQVDICVIDRTNGFMDAFQAAFQLGNKGVE